MSKRCKKCYENIEDFWEIQTCMGFKGKKMEKSNGVKK